MLPIKDDFSMSVIQYIYVHNKYVQKKYLHEDLCANDVCAKIIQNRHLQICEQSRSTVEELMTMCSL